MNLSQASKGFSAAGSEHRLEVLMALVRSGPAGLSVGALQRCVNIPASTLAHHLRHLCDSGLIKQVKHGRQVLNRAEYGHIRELAEYLLNQCCQDASECPNNCS